MGKQRLESPAPAPARSWTRIEDYLRPLQRRSRRHLPRLEPRSEPDRPLFLLSTLPFVALLAAMIVLTAAIIVIAWPPSRPKPVAHAPAKVRELGTAPTGWFQEAQKQFR